MANGNSGALGNNGRSVAIDDRDTFLGGNGGDDYDVLDLTGFDVDHIVYDPSNAENGTVYFGDGSTMIFENIEHVIPCFTPGTLIATPEGEVLVEDLKAGDKVFTRDNGIQEIRWLGRSDVDTVELLKRPQLKPILIQKGALGDNLPERDMLVSPQHRILVADDRTALYFEEREVLVAAKHLVNGDTIREVEVANVSYIHFMFDQHEVVLSDGIWTESFQPELRSQEGRHVYTAARKLLKKNEVMFLKERDHVSDCAKTGSRMVL